jgi:hypothetical protein
MPYNLSTRWRRVFEDTRTKEWRFHPLRSQRRDFGKLNGRDRGADEWRMSSMIVAAGSDHCHRATVLDTIRVGVDALVQLRRDTERERPEKRRGYKCRDKNATAIM